MPLDTQMPGIVPCTDLNGRPRACAVEVERPSPGRVGRLRGA